MAQETSFREIERLSLALADAAYRANEVRVVRTDLQGFSHIVASRQGLFAVNETAHCLVAHGIFFGITIRGDDIYVFEACDRPRRRSRQGRIIRLTRRGDRIVGSDVVATGLDNGCHQIDIVNGGLCVLDTYHQTVVRLSLDGGETQVFRPLPRPEGGVWSPGYAHVNSLLQVGERILLLLHNGAQHTGRPSAVAVFDRDWQEIDRWVLPGDGCHSLAMTEDANLLCCGSIRGELVGVDGLRVDVSPMMTRGLSVGLKTIAVGASHFSIPLDGRLPNGTITFLDRAYRINAVLDLPAAPTEIRRLDGRDLSLSTFASQCCQVSG